MVACSTPGIEGFETIDIVVGGESLTVAVADTPPLRSQGLQSLDELPEGLDGMLFVFELPQTASFHMRTVGLDLDIWWFDEEGSLLGSTEMVTCLDIECVTYPSPGRVKWALETRHASYTFTSGQLLGFP